MFSFADFKGTNFTTHVCYLATQHYMGDPTVVYNVKMYIEPEISTSLTLNTKYNKMCIIVVQNIIMPISMHDRITAFHFDQRTLSAHTTLF